MVGLSTMHSVHIPVRSISLPTRLHPKSLKIEAELTKLKTWQSSSATNPLEAETIQNGLTRLAELFNGIEELIHSPQTQQAFQYQHLTLVEEALDGSVGLLDLCGTARDMVLIMREHVQDLQSALRRRGIGSSIESNIHAYINFRKMANKDICKSLKTLKRIENNAAYIPHSNIDHHLSFVLSVIREANSIATSIFRSLLLLLSTPLMKANTTSGWSLVLRLTRSGLLASYRGQKIFNKLECVDIAVCSILGQIRKNEVNVAVREVQRRLEMLDVSIKGLEAKLNCMFRCLVQNRVSLLNLITV